MYKNSEYLNEIDNRRKFVLRKYTRLIKQAALVCIGGVSEIMNTLEKNSNEKQNTNDLYSKVFYKVSFSISTAPGQSDLDMLWELIMHIKRWLIGKENKWGIVHINKDNRCWTKFKFGNQLYDTNNSKTFYAESLFRSNPENEKDISWACKIRECRLQKGYAPRWWTTEVGYQTMSNGAARLSFVVSYKDAMGFMGLCQDTPEINIPIIVKNIQNDDRFICSVNDDPLQVIDPISVRVGQGHLLKELLYDKERSIPIVLIMPKKIH